MFDDLRNSDQPIFQGEELNKPQPVPKSSGFSAPRKKKSGKFLGMTAVQRFVLSTLLFLTACMVSIVVLLVTGRIAVF
ncbi:MAG: hypothetical protein N2117_05095 [Anaerolineales bacterium]|nr:hypothetical protein [Anaerolineales bacterium]MCX7754606.1 hypothetical protein [Anaerolineales bacterium]MDW8278113.1 hypothetical protein [Anaerolineales bacterium]